MRRYAASEYTMFSLIKNCFRRVAEKTSYLMKNQFDYYRKTGDVRNQKKKCISANGSRLSEVAGDPLAGRQTFWITAVMRCRVATRITAGTATHYAKERSDFA